MTKIKKKHKALKIIIIVSAILIVLLGVMRYLFGNKEVMFGANVNSMSYSKDISPQNYSSVDEAIIIIFNALCFFLIFVILQSSYNVLFHIISPYSSQVSPDISHSS